MRPSWVIKDSIHVFTYLRLVYSSLNGHRCHFVWLSQRPGISAADLCRVGIAGGWGWGDAPQFMSTDALFEWKSVLQNFKHLDIWSWRLFRSVPTLERCKTNNTFCSQFGAELTQLCPHCKGMRRWRFPHFHVSASLSLVSRDVGYYSTKFELSSTYGQMDVIQRLLAFRNDVASLTYARCTRFRSIILGT